MPIESSDMTSYLMTIVMFALSFTIYEINSKQIKFPSFELENEGQGQGKEIEGLSHSTRNFLFYTADFFRILATWQHRFTQTVQTHLQAQLRDRGADYINIHRFT